MTYTPTPYQAVGYKNSHNSRSLISIYQMNEKIHENYAPCFAEMERLRLITVDVYALMCHLPWWNDLNTLHPNCDWESLEVNIASCIPLYYNKPCVYYEEN